MSKQYLHGAAVIIERALKAAPSITERLDAEEKNETESVKVPKVKKTGYIWTDPEFIEKMPYGINRVFLEEFNRRNLKYDDFIEYALANGYAENYKKADNLVHNAIKILKENADSKFSRILLLCGFLNIQLDFIIDPVKPVKVGEEIEHD